MVVSLRRNAIAEKAPRFPPNVVLHSTALVIGEEQMDSRFRGNDGLS